MLCWQGFKPFFGNAKFSAPENRLKRLAGDGFHVFLCTTKFLGTQESSESSSLPRSFWVEKNRLKHIAGGNFICHRPGQFFRAENLGGPEEHPKTPCQKLFQAIFGTKNFVVPKIL